MTQETLTPPVGPDDHVRGPETALVMVLVYGDYQCPYTRRGLHGIKALEQRIGDQFKLAFRQFPLREIHPDAESAAELAEAAADQGKFWEVHEHLFAHQDALDWAALTTYAAHFGIPNAGGDSGHFEAGHLYADRVEDDVQSGLRSGVQGTPTIFVNGRHHHDNYDEATLERAIQLAR